MLDTLGCQTVGLCDINHYGIIYDVMADGHHKYEDELIYQGDHVLVLMKRLQPLMNSNLQAQVWLPSRVYIGTIVLNTLMNAVHTRGCNP